MLHIPILFNPFGTPTLGPRNSYQQNDDFGAVCCSQASERPLGSSGRVMRPCHTTPRIATTKTLIRIIPPKSRGRCCYRRFSPTMFPFEVPMRFDSRHTWLELGWLAEQGSCLLNRIWPIRDNIYFCLRKRASRVCLLPEIPSE